MTKRKKKTIKQHRQEAFMLGAQAEREAGERHIKDTIQRQLASERAKFKNELQKDASLERFRTITNTLSGFSEMIGLAISSLKEFDKETK